MQPSPPQPPQSPFARWLIRNASWRAALLISVFLLGFMGFSLGGVVSERPGIASAPFAARVYYTLGLFVLAGIDLGLPRSGPVVAQAMLWVAFFAAPLVTAGAVTEGLIRVFRADLWGIRRMRGHVVLAGCGRLSMLYLVRLRAKLPRVPVVIVESRMDNANVAVARARGARVIFGDITDDVMLDALHLQYATRVMLLTGDDFVNLDAATKILARVPTISNKLVVHVADLRFSRILENTQVAQKCVLFNSHRVAAAHLVSTVLIPHFDKTPTCDALVLGGFGRFGQTVLSELSQHRGDALQSVVIIDTQATRAEAEFSEQITERAACERHVIDGDLSDPTVWRRAAALCETYSPVFVLGSDDDGANLRTAVWLKRTWPNALVIARGFGASSFAFEVSKEQGFISLSVGELLADSIPDRWLQ
ncbi:MAG: NAD-binding protein [Deltaproteobacteria bacterium]|nr:NAD-binding protein [Deltaproteobacteria bacterium]